MSDIPAFPPPWQTGRTAIHAFMADHIGPATQGLPEEALHLPDEPQANPRGAPLWLSNAFAVHWAVPDVPAAERILSALRAACAAPSAVHVGTLYGLLLRTSVARFAEPLLRRIVEEKDIDAAARTALARWLVLSSPDREPVKLGLLLLGLSRAQQDVAAVTLLARHFEFTLYAAAALGRMLPEAEADAAWWTLAHHHDGWGRIHLVRHLSRTRNPEIKRWLLREGFRNAVMVEYLAHACATGGDLLEALSAPEIDDALLHSAGTLIDGLIRGGPAKDMRDYPQGAQAVAAYLGHLERRPPADVRDVLTLRVIARHVEEERWRGEKVAHAWPEGTARRIGETAAQLIADPRWALLVRRDLEAEDASAFEVAAAAAGAIGIDAWEPWFERVRQGTLTHWGALMGTDDPARIDRVVSLAIERLMPRAPEPSDPGFPRLDALSTVLHGLRRFPGKGWPLVAAALRAASTANRGRALQVLADWTRERWPPDAAAAIEAARLAEPDEHLRANMARVLDGLPPEPRVRRRPAPPPAPSPGTP